MIERHLTNYILYSTGTPIAIHVLPYSIIIFAENLWGKCDSVEIHSQSGARYTIENYSDYHWMNNEGYIGRNNTGTSPGPEWRELITPPR